MRPSRFAPRRAIPTAAYRTRLPSGSACGCVSIGYERTQAPVSGQTGDSVWLAAARRHRARPEIRFAQVGGRLPYPAIYVRLGARYVSHSETTVLGRRAAPACGQPRRWELMGGGRRSVSPRESRGRHSLHSAPLRLSERSVLIADRHAVLMH